MGLACCKQAEVPIERLQVIKHLPQAIDSPSVAPEPKHTLSELAHRPSANDSPPVTPVSKRSLSECYLQNAAPEPLLPLLPSSPAQEEKALCALVTLKFPNQAEVQVERKLFQQPEHDVLDLSSSRMLTDKPGEEDIIWFDISKAWHIDGLVAYIGMVSCLL